jgi:hypothetical protein
LHEAKVVARTRRITILLNPDEAELWDSVRNHAFPPGITARTMLLDACQFLANKGLRQTAKPHVATNVRRGQQPAPENNGVTYDYSDAQ